MAAHEYWQISVSATRAGEQYVSAKEVKLYDAAGDQITGLTVTSNDNFAGLGGANANDGNLGTVYIADGNAAFPKVLTFTKATPFEPRSFDWVAADGSDGRNRSPHVATVRHSDDGSSYTDVATVYAQEWYAGGQTKRFHIPQPGETGIRFVRARVTGTGDGTYVECGEFGAFVAQDGTGTNLALAAQMDQTLIFGSDASTAAPRTNDGDTATYSLFGGGLPQSLYMSLPAAVAYLGSFTWRANSASRAPTDITFEWSANANPVGTWTELWTETGLSWSSSETKTFVNPTAPGPVAASLVLTPPSATLAPAATQQLTAVVYDAEDAEIEGAEVTYDSSDDAVATVDGSGLVTAVADGSATITATSGAASDTSAITVAIPAETTRRSARGIRIGVGHIGL